MKDPEHPRHDEAKAQLAEFANGIKESGVVSLLVSPSGFGNLGDTYAHLNGFSGIKVPDRGALFGAHLMSTMPKLDLSALVPKIDFSLLVSDLLETLRPALDDIATRLTSTLADSIKGIVEAAKRSIPDNWHPNDIRSPDNMDELLAEGLPLAWIPPQTVLRKVLAAPDANSRRRVYESNRVFILNATCLRLEEIADPEVSRLAQFARRSADALRAALRAAHREASQAFSANLLDTLLPTYFSEDDRTLCHRSEVATRHGLDIRAGLVGGAIWGAYGQLWVKNGNEIPRKFSRQASVHGVSRRQYTIANAVIALCHAVALLRLIDFETARSKR